MNNWTQTQLKTICAVSAGQGAPQSDSDYADSGTPFIKAGNLNELLNGKTENELLLVSEETVKKYKLKKYSAGSVVFAKSGMSCTKGYVYTLKQDAYVVSHLAILTPFAIKSEFLNYYLRFIKTYSLIKDAAYPTISLGDIENMSIPVPSLEEQERIVSVLDEKFAQIDILKKNAEKNLQNAKELFLSRLGSFFEDHSWRKMSLYDVCEIRSKLVDPTEKQYLEMFHIGGANIESETGRIIDLKTSRDEKLTSGKFTFDSTMVLYNKIRPYLKKVARPDFCGLCSADMYPLSPKENMTRDFLYYILQSNNFTEYAISKSDRAGMPKVNREALFAYQCPVPPIEEQNRMSNELWLLENKQKSLAKIYNKQIEDCEELKQSLLDKAFSGEL